MTKRWVILPGLLCLSLVGVICEPRVDFTFVNATDVTIDVGYIDNGPIFDDVRAFYEDAEVGVVDDRLRYTTRGLESNLIAIDGWYSEDGYRFIFFARESVTNIILFKQHYTHSQLKELDWTIEITDMRTEAGQ